MWFPKLIPELNYLLLGISGILLLIALDVITGIASALRHKEFCWCRITEFLTYSILPYVIVWGSFGAIPYLMLLWNFPNIVINAVISFDVVAFAFIVAELVNSIKENILEIFGKDIFPVEEPISERYTYDKTPKTEDQLPPIEKTALEQLDYGAVSKSDKVED